MVRFHRAAGFLAFEKARVRWFLSINADTLPDEAKRTGKRTYRSILIEGEELICTFAESESSQPAAFVTVTL